MAHSLDAGLRLCFIRAPLARASDARRSPKSSGTILRCRCIIRRRCVCLTRALRSSYRHMDTRFTLMRWILLFVACALMSSARAQQFRTNDVSLQQALGILERYESVGPWRDFTEEKTRAFLQSNGLLYGYAVGGKTKGALFYVLADGKSRLDLGVCVRPFTQNIRTRHGSSEAIEPISARFASLQPVDKLDPCLNNIRQIEGAAVQWALATEQSTNGVPEWSDIRPYLGLTGTNELRCPLGGVYKLAPACGHPTCSLAEHVKLCDEEYTFVHLRP
jgi:hypothetical protein